MACQCGSNRRFSTPCAVAVGVMTGRKRSLRRSRVAPAWTIEASGSSEGVASAAAASVSKVDVGSSESVPTTKAEYASR